LTVFLFAFMIVASLVSADLYLNSKVGTIYVKVSEDYFEHPKFLAILQEGLFDVSGTMLIK